MSFTVTRVDGNDVKMMRKVLDLLQSQELRFDDTADDTYAVLDDDYNVAATGSLCGNTLRCIAVSGSYAGEGLTNILMSRLLEEQYARGNTHVFLYTKPSSAKYFADLGFHEIVRTGSAVFMENRRTGFRDYLKSLSGYKKEGTSAAIVMNANPFTLGHQYLVESAAVEYDTVHLFVVSEEKSLIPFEIRKKLVLEGTSHIPNIICHDSGPYIVSNATFPSYFQKSEEDVIRSHAETDVAVFARIAEALGITARFVGEEPDSLVTGLYNKVMQDELPEHGISCFVVPRVMNHYGTVSASTVRSLIKDGNMSVLSEYLPESSLSFFMSDEAAPVIDRIRKSDSVVHY